MNHGLRVFTCGHSFHAWSADLVREFAQAANLEKHRVVGVSMIGASLANWHWEVPDEKNEAKKTCWPAMSMS